MKDYIKKIFTIIFSFYFSIFIVNFVWERLETGGINRILKKNYYNAINKFETSKTISGLNYIITIDHQNFLFFKDKINKFQIYPLSSFSNKKVFLCNEHGENVYIKTDKYGFRNSNYSYKNFDTYLIGDSFGLGICHSDEDFFVNKMSNKIINLSQGGTSVKVQSAILREFANFKENTKLLWLFYLGNDLDELKVEMFNPYLKKYNNWDYYQSLSNKNIIKDKMLHEINQIKTTKGLENNTFNGLEKKSLERKYLLKKNHNLLKLVKINFVRNKIYQKFFRLYPRVIIDEYLKTIIETKNKLNIKDLTIIILPDSRVFNYKHYRKLYEIDYIKKRLNSNDIKTIDLPIFFDNKYDLYDFFYSRNTHYSKGGNDIIGKKINYCLKNNQYLDCK